MEPMTSDGTGSPPDEVDVPVDADLAELLADPSVWAEPPDDLEARVVDAVSNEASGPRS